MKTQDFKKAQDYFEAKLAFTTGPVELNLLIEAQARIAIIDVRSEENYNREHIPGAVNLPRDAWPTLKGLLGDCINIVYCYSQQCHLAAKAALEFSRDGFAVQELEGGFNTYKEHGFPVEKTPTIIG